MNSVKTSVAIFNLEGNCSLCRGVSGHLRGRAPLWRMHRKCGGGGLFRSRADALFL